MSEQGQEPVFHKPFALTPSQQSWLEGRGLQSQMLRTVYFFAYGNCDHKIHTLEEPYSCFSVNCKTITLTMYSSQGHILSSLQPWQGRRVLSVLSLALAILLQLINWGGDKFGLTLTIWQGGRSHQGQCWGVPLPLLAGRHCHQTLCCTVSCNRLFTKAHELGVSGLLNEMEVRCPLQIWY